MAKKFKHDVVAHGLGVYVIGSIHTNTIEGFWSHLKRGIVGIYHQVSPKHLDRYIDEYEYRYNTCKSGEVERFNNMPSLSSKRLTYKNLVATA